MADWCKANGFRLKPAVYIDEGIFDLGHNEARLVRSVAPSERAAKHRNPQKYTVELCVHDELFYPLGTKPMSKEKLVAALLADTLEWSTG